MHGLPECGRHRHPYHRTCACTSSDLVFSPAATAWMRSYTSRPMSSSDARPSRMRPASTSISSDMRLYVFGLGLFACGDRLDEVVHFAPDVVQRCTAFQNAAGIDIHIIGHALVRLRIGSFRLRRPPG